MVIKTSIGTFFFLNHIDISHCLLALPKVAFGHRLQHSHLVSQS